jgi:hypothetical protein
MSSESFEEERNIRERGARRPRTVKPARSFRFSRKKNRTVPVLSLQTEIPEETVEYASLLNALYADIFNSTSFNDLRMVSDEVLHSRLRNEDKQILLGIIDRQYAQLKKEAGFGEFEASL